MLRRPMKKAPRRSAGLSCLCGALCSGANPCPKRPSLAQLAAPSERLPARCIAANIAKLQTCCADRRRRARRDEVAAAPSRCPRYVGLCSNCGRIAATRPTTQGGHGRTSEMPRRVYPASKNPIKRHHVVVAGPSGISSVKLVPREEVGSISSPPSCFESALTKRVPSRLLVVES